MKKKTVKEPPKKDTKKKDPIKLASGPKDKFLGTATTGTRG